MAFASGFGAAASGTEIPVQQTLQDSVQSLQWSPTANLLCAGGWNGEVGSFLFLYRAERGEGLLPSLLRVHTPASWGFNTMHLIAHASWRTLNHSRCAAGGVECVW